MAVVQHEDMTASLGHADIKWELKSADEQLTSLDAQLSLLNKLVIEIETITLEGLMDVTTSQNALLDDLDGHVSCSCCCCCCCFFLGFVVVLFDVFVLCVFVSCCCFLGFSYCCCRCCCCCVCLLTVCCFFFSFFFSFSFLLLFLLLFLFDCLLSLLLLIRTKHNTRIFGVISFIKLQNYFKCRFVGLIRGTAPNIPMFCFVLIHSVLFLTLYMFGPFLER